MIKWIGFGFLLGVLVFLAAVFVPWKFIVICIALFIAISPFMTSGKGDRDYTRQ